MKKNKALRAASALMVLTMLTTSIIGGTFAKYTTSDSANDTARVAKFGVVATVSGDLFGSTYKAVANGNTVTAYSKNGGTVSADTEDVKVVAPGTKNEKGLTLSVTGTPEVSTKVTFGTAKNESGDSYANSDIYLASGTYGVMVQYKGELTKDNIINYYTLSDGTYSKATPDTELTTTVYELHDVAQVNADYYPMTWKVNVDSTTAEKTNAEGVVGALNEKFKDKTFAPNADNALSATVTWEWPFEVGDNDAAKAERNAKDTILGDMIAASLTEENPIAVVAKNDDGTYTTVTYNEEAAATDSANKVVNAYNGDTKVACLTAAFNAAITVEQVD